MREPHLVLLVHLEVVSEAERVVIVDTLADAVIRQKNRVALLAELTHLIRLSRFLGEGDLIAALDCVWSIANVTS